MKITLERPELIQLIGKSLGYAISDEDISIQAEPFEVSIRNVDLSGRPKLKDNIPEEPEEPAEEQTPAAAVLTMNEILNQNSVRGGPKPPRNVVEDSVPLTRNLGPLESEDPPPVTQAEISAVLRGNY